MKKLNLHDSFNERDTSVGMPSERSFGRVFIAFFVILSFLPLCFGKAMMLWPLVVAFALLLVTLFSPVILRPFNWVWLKFGLLLHCIVSPVILGAIFFLVVTPTAVLMRIFGKDPLRLKRSSQPTYWINRTEAITKDSLKNQF
ncbi:MAG: SxtJ family membrane protein [Verrucomicrobiota bacterium]